MAVHLEQRRSQPLAADARPADAGPTASTSLGHRPALDGLRGLAIAVVVWAHLPGSWYSGGTTAVDVFFVLSGFLITTLLLEEWQRTSAISLRRFWVRRACRLLPALVVFVPCVVLVTIFEGADPFISVRSGLFALLSLSNLAQAVTPGFSSFLGPTWSLSMEEQFYLGWPLALTVMLRRSWSATRLVLMTATAIVVIAAWRIEVHSGGATYNRVRLGLDTHADVLLIGCLLAMLFTGGVLRRPQARRVTSTLIGPAALLLLAMIYAGGPSHSAALATWGYPAVAVSTAIVIAHLLGATGTVLGRILSIRPLTWLGRRSYALYLWHYLVLGVAARMIERDLTVIVVTLAVSIVLAEASWRIVERPWLRRRDRLSSLS